MMSYNSPIVSQGTVPPPSAPGVSGVLPGQSAVNTTRILSLTGFSKELKTRDIQSIFVDFEDDRGGYRIKWLDDTGCLIVFSDPLTAKKAFLQLLASPHPHLVPSKTAEGQSVTPKLVPYTDEDAGSVISSVANRPRSRSIANNNNNLPNGSPSGSGSGHARRMSNSSSGMHARGVSAAGGGINGGEAQYRGERRSFGRQSLGQSQMQAIMDEANSAIPPSTNNSGDRAPSPLDATNTTSSASTTGGAIDWSSMTQNPIASNRARTVSGSQTSIHAGPSYSPPVSPERGMRAGATSPSTLRRLVQQRG